MLIALNRVVLDQQKTDIEKPMKNINVINVFKLNTANKITGLPFRYYKITTEFNGK
jgi:hypothetical protein